MSTLGSTGMSPHRLWLEVTETSLVEDVEEASGVLHRLAERGVRISIDDFGTGWASLTYLKRFPVHALKIDRSFVSAIQRNASDAAIARSILSLGSELGLAVVAEGIENLGQQRALQDLGCSMGQGFLFGGPTPAAAVPLDRALRDGSGRVESPFGRVVAERTDVAAGAPRRARHGFAMGSTTDVVAGTLRALLGISSAEGAAELLQHAAEALGATLVAAPDVGPDALTIDLSLGEGPPLLAEVEQRSPARTELESVLARLAEDARQAVDLLRRSERLEVDVPRGMFTGLASGRS